MEEKIYKLGKVDDRIQIIQPARSRNKRQKEIEINQSTKMVLDQAQKI